MVSDGELFHDNFNPAWKYVFIKNSISSEVDNDSTFRPHE